MSTFNDEFVYSVEYVTILHLTEIFTDVHEPTLRSCDLHDLKIISTLQIFQNTWTSGKDGEDCKFTTSTKRQRLRRCSEFR